MNPGHSNLKKFVGTLYLRKFEPYKTSHCENASVKTFSELAPSYGFQMYFH